VSRQHLRVLGIDPGSRRTGFGVIDFFPPRQTRYVTSGVIAAEGDSVGPKLKSIFDGVRQVVAGYVPGQIAVESVFMSRNAQSALKLGQARGVAIAAALLCEIELAEYSATQIKKAVVGRGKATKDQVQQMVRHLLELPQSPVSDAADALACAICHCHYQRGWYASILPVRSVAE